MTYINTWIVTNEGADDGAVTALPIALEQLLAASAAFAARAEAAAVVAEGAAEGVASPAWSNIQGKPAAFPPSTHAHTVADVTGLQTALDAKLASASYTAADVLTKVKTVDGSGSGLDADLVRGTTPSAYGLSLIDDADAAAARETLGLGSAATAVATDFVPADHVGSSGSAHAAATTSASGFMSASDKSKLDGVATGATANSSDATLLSRANHTGSQAISTVTGLQGSLDAKLAAASVGAAGGVAPLDGSGKVAAVYLPSFVDDVVEAASYTALPGTGEAGKIYVTLDTGKAWRWGGSSYAEISASPGSTDAVPEGAANLYHSGSRVLSTVLSGLSTATNAVITASDTVLGAFGKIQAQTSAISATAVVVKGGSSGDFQDAVDTVQNGGKIIVPPGTYPVPTVTNAASKSLVWEVWGSLSSTTQNWADVLPGGAVVRPGRRSATTGIPEAIGGYADLEVPSDLGLSAIDVHRVYVRDRGHLPSSSAQGRLNGLHYIIDVQAGAYGVRQTITGECNIVGQPGQTAGNGNFCGVVGLGAALSPASSGPIPDSVFGGNFYGRVAAGASGWFNATGGESDCETNAPVVVKTGHQVAGLGAYRGTSIDAAFWAEYWTSGQSWKAAFQAGGNSPYPAIGGDGTFAKCAVPAGISYGVDFFGTPIAQSYLRGNDINLIPGEAQFSRAGQVIKFGNPTTASNVIEYWYTSGHGTDVPDAMVYVAGGSGASFTGSYVVQAGEFVVDSPCLRPASDGWTNLGAGTFRFSTVFAATGTINTSDAAMKRWRGEFTDAELDAIGEINFGVYQWLDAVEAKGDGARLHAGALAQQIRDAFARHGIDSSRYGLWCEDPLIEEVEEVEEVDVPEMEDYEDTVERIDIVEGRAVVSTETVTRERQRMIAIPVVDADGVVVMSPGRPGRPERMVVDPDTGAVTIEPAIPAIDATPRVHYVPATRTETRTKRVATPVLDDFGTPKTRLGLRYDQVLIMRQAWLERELSRMAARVALVTG